MSHDDIDQALRHEPEIAPSPGFSQRVMRSVRHEAAHRRAIPFPWKPIAGGLGVAAAATFIGVLGGGTPSEAVLAPLPEHLAEALTWLTTTLVGILGLTWGSVRFARRQA